MGFNSENKRIAMPSGFVDQILDVIRTVSSLLFLQSLTFSQQPNIAQTNNTNVLRKIEREWSRRRSIPTAKCFCWYTPQAAMNSFYNGTNAHWPCRLILSYSLAQQTKKLSEFQVKMYLQIKPSKFDYKEDPETFLPPPENGKARI